MTEPDEILALADEFEAAIRITIGKRNEAGRVVTENLMLPHRNVIIAALRLVAAAPRAREALQRISVELSALRKRDPATYSSDDELARIRSIALAAL
jgi:hypothetical protein